MIRSRDPRRRERIRYALRHRGIAADGGKGTGYELLSFFYALKIRIRCFYKDFCPKKLT